MFDLSVSVSELIVRAVAVYVFLFALLRFLGKKHVGELAPFDLVVLLILSETVSSALSGGDESLIGGLISATTLIGLVQLVSYLSWRSKRIARFLEGTPKILVCHGARNKDAMEQEQVTVTELLEALRHNGHANIGDIRTAILENDGKISFVMRQKETSA
jgi:uncharacterized membrane protein YcaP (DUF421 family)